MHAKKTGVVVLSLVVLLTVPAFGGDQPTVVYPDPEQYVASQGDTVEIPVIVNSDGGYDDAGLARLSVNVSFDPESLTAVGVETASYLEQGEETDVHDETAIDNGEGAVTVEQWRDPERGGATGHQRFATVTFEIDENAPAGNTTVTFEDSRAELIDNYPITVFGHNATVSIEQGTAESSASGTVGEAGTAGDGGILSSDAVGTTSLLAIAVAMIALGVVGAVVVRSRRE